MTAPERADRHVDVEVVLFHLGAAGLLHRVLRAPLPDGVDPDEMALLLSGAARPDVSHSTSWRTEGDLLVLTYAVLPDPDPHGEGELLSSGIVTSGDPTRPRPSELGVHHVAAHAARHLAYLCATDPTVAQAARASTHSDLWNAIAAAATLPVATHDLLAHSATRAVDDSDRAARRAAGQASG